ncbi:MAG: PfkB family carbohydrate kinase, partial [Sphaerochaetaceae bacterium]
DVCIANEEDAADVFGIHASKTDINSGTLNLDGYIDVAKQIIDKFGCKKVAITLRGSISASVNEWGAMLYDGKDAYFSPRYTIQIVDRVGGGDSFGAALIYASLHDYPMQDAINFAVAASCLKHTIEYDFNIVSVDEVKALAAGNASGRVQR